MIDNLNKIGNNYITILEMETVIEKYRTMKDLYRVVRKMLTRWIESDWQEGAIEDLLQGFMDNFITWNDKLMKLEQE